MTFDLRLAGLIGSHAVPSFLCGIALLLTTVSAVWLLRKRCRATSRAPHAPQRALVAHWVVALAVAGGAALIFLEMAEASRAHEAMAGFDAVLAQALGESVSPVTARLFGAATHLGDPATLTVLGLVVAVALVAFRQRGLAAFWIVALVGNGSINTVLKNVYERARPNAEVLHQLTVPSLANGWSFPSGHTSGAVVAFGALAYILVCTTPSRWHLPVVLFAVAVAFTVAVSRVVLQVHWASDVVAGSISGMLWLAVCVLTVEWLGRR